MSRKAEYDHPALPGSAKLLGYNRDVSFYLSGELELVFIVQGNMVWTLKARPGATASQTADELAFLQGAGAEEPLLGADPVGRIRGSDNPDGFHAGTDTIVPRAPGHDAPRRARADPGRAGTALALFRRMRKRAAGR